MSDFLKKNSTTLIIVLGTLILAVIAIFTAIRLYQTRQGTVAPNAPTSKPAAATVPPTYCQLQFTVSTTTPACNSNCTSDSNCPSGMTCYQPPMPDCSTPGVSCIQVLPPKVCRNPQNPTNTSCASPTPSPTATPTATPVPQCGTSCSTNSDCPSTMVCYVGVCRNPSCTTSTSCVCATATPTATPTITPAPTSTSIGATATPTSTAIAVGSPSATPTLPVSGTTTPTIIAVLGGIILILASLAFAL